MTVYVDPLSPSLKNSKWRYKKHCHLVGNDLEELHQFAIALGLRREWFQTGGRMDHYDITESKRRLAIQLGAVPITWRQLSAFMQNGNVET